MLALSGKMLVDCCYISSSKKIPFHWLLGEIADMWVQMSSYPQKL